MTEKRFWSEDYTLGYYTEIVDNDKELQDVPNPKKNLTIDEAVDLLNKLNDSNNFLSDFRGFITTEHQKIKEENEQLKQELRIYRKVANCGNCEYHNYDWYDDGDEFEVCDKGNDMWYRICEDWREL